MNYLIARVSDVSQRKALPGQRQNLFDYAKKLKWVENKDFKYIEYDETAYKENRPKFREQVVVPLQNEKELAIAVFDKIDRFSRDTVADDRKALTTLFRKGRIELHFPSDNLFISKSSPASDLFRLDIGVALAAYYSSATRDNVRRRFNEMVNNKTWVGKAPIGYENYKVGDDANGKPIKGIRINEEKYQHVLKGFELRSLGWSYGAIAKDRKAAGLLGSKRRGKSIPLSKGKWEAIIKNPFYMGEMLYMGKQYPHKYPVLIEPWLWFKCQRVNEERSHARTKYRSKPFLFKRLKCHECGCTVSFDGPKGAGRNVYGRCTGYTGKHTPKWVNEKILIEQFKEVLASITVPEAVVPEIVAEIERHHTDEQDYFLKHKKTLQKEYDAIDERIKQNFENATMLKERPDLFEAIVAEANARQRAIMQELESLGDGDKAFVVGAAYIVDVCKRAVELFEAETTSIEQKRYLIDFVVSNMVLEGEKLHLTLKEPFNAVAKMQKNGNWCG